MEKVRFLVLFLAMFFLNTGCKNLLGETNEKTEPLPEYTDDVVIGGDKDENGCLTAAGYTWSKVNQECVRIFELGIQLLPVNKKDSDAVFAAYVMFSNSGDVAEVFLPNTNSSILFKATDNANWSYEDWILQLQDNRYLLIQNNKLQYQGDNEFGPKITGNKEQE